MKRIMKKKQYTTAIAIGLVIITILLSIGWSAFNSSMLIGNYAYVRVPSEVRVTAFSLSQATEDALGTYENFGVDYITADASLPNANSTITYEIEITNMQLAPGVNVGIFSTSSLPEELSILSWSGYNLKEKICDDDDPTDCGVGAQKTFYITIGYTSSEYYDSSKTDFKFDLTFYFREFHNITYNNISGNYPDSIIDGDDFNITLDNISILELVVEGASEYVNGLDFNYNDNVLSIIEVHEDLLISRLPSYTITYDANGGKFDNNATTNSVTYLWRNEQNMILSGTEKTPTNGTDAFYDWFTDNSTYTTVFDKTSEINQSRTVYAKWIDKIAEINGTFYDSLQLAIASVKASDGLVTIRLLKNTKENLSVGVGLKININLQGYTVTNKENDALLTNKGELGLYNGSLISTATSAATINNDSGSSLVLEDCNVALNNKSGKQALYSYGAVEVRGNSTLSSSSTLRATVQILSSGSFTMLGGSVYATGNKSALNSAGSMVFGTKDGNIYYDKPLIQGAYYGIEGAGNINFYDGIIKGKNGAVANINNVKDKEPEHELVSDEESIGGVKYKVLYLDAAYRVTFNPNGGSVSESFRPISNGHEIGALPEAARAGYIFEGWFTSASGGEEVTADTIITDNVTFYAHWTRAYTVIMNGTKYYAIVDAVTAAPNRTKTTMTLLRDATENIVIASSKNIVLDLNNYTLKNVTNAGVVEINGNFEVANGTIETNSSTNAAINVREGGHALLDNVSVFSHASRQAVYIYGGGSAEISGNSYIYSETTGFPTGSVIERASVNNLEGGTLVITGGTFVGKYQQAISNEGTMIIGTAGDGIDTSSPVFIGATYGIKSLVPFEYYDGVAKGVSGAILGTTVMEDDTRIVDGSEVLDGITYITQHIESTQ